MTAIATPPRPKRVTFNADADLLDEAREVLGTGTTTDTINTALAEVVRQKRIEFLLEHDFADLTPEVLAEIRRGRTGRW